MAERGRAEPLAIPSNELGNEVKVFTDSGYDSEEANAYNGFQESNVEGEEDLGEGGSLPDVSSVNSRPTLQVCGKCSPYFKKNSLEVRYPCPLCKNEYVSSESRKIHVIGNWASSHQNKTLQPVKYHCPFCRMGFFNQPTAKEHLKYVHKCRCKRRWMEMLDRDL